MARARRQHHRWILPTAVAGSLLVHPVVGLIYQATRAARPTRLLVDVSREGAGQGLVQSSAGGLRCEGTGEDDETCAIEVEPGSRITLSATPGEKSTFQGWTGPCGPQAHHLFRWGFEALYADAQPEPGDPGRALYEEMLLRSADPPPPEFPLQCEVTLDRTARVTAKFGEQPEEQSVEWVAMEDVVDPPDMQITVPDPALEAQNVVRMDPPAPMPDVPLPEEPPPQQMPEVAQVEPPPPTPVTPTPVEPPPPPKKEEAQAPRMKAVEVPDENEVEEAPDDARFLSDKNRDVAEETHAEDTNLEKQQDGKVAASEKSDVKSEQVGGEEDRIRQMEETEPTSLDAERLEETDHSGKDEVARGIERGDEGEGGDGGEGGDDTEAKKPGLLSMRGIAGRGAPGGPVAEQETAGRSGASRDGDGGKRGRVGTKGRRGIKTDLDFEDYERIVGKDKVEKEQREVARRSKSLKRGRWEQKLAAVKSSLENFTPEVRPGNQTALKTRAAPFAVYIARMHRRIHELWGFGFLEDLDSKPASHELNDWTLWTKIEVVVNQDGTVDKVNIVRPSGVLPFDVAALDTILTSGPFEPPPEAIRSADGKTYLHWAFHRDWRQCGTFGAEPFILSTPPKGGQRDRGLSDGEVLGRAPKVGGKSRTARGTAGGAGDHAGHDHDGHAHPGDAPARDEVAENAARARAASQVATPDDPAAQHAANLWLTGFTKGDIAKMVGVSGVPFQAGAGLVASSGSEIGAVYRNILKETRGRTIREWKVLSAAGYRKAVGALPKGVEQGPGDLFMVVRLAKERFTLQLRPHGGEYRAVGFYR